MSIAWEQVVIASYRRHLIVVLPLTILAFKLIVRVVAREPKKDVFRSLLVLPLDFIYIAMAVLLAAAARRDPNLIAHYGSDLDTDMAVVIQTVLLVTVAIIITVCDRWARILWGKFFAAWTMFNEEEAKRPASLTATSESASNSGQLPLQLTAEVDSGMSRESGVLLAWILFYWTGMMPLVFLEFVLAVICLGSILDRLK
jgi:hypothetical protein